MLRFGSLSVFVLLAVAGCTGASSGDGVAVPAGPQAAAATDTAAFAPNSDDEVGPNGLPAGTRANSAEPDYGVVGVGHLAPF